jgi:iron complex outermembrane receptor protein
VAKGTYLPRPLERSFSAQADLRIWQVIRKWVMLIAVAVGLLASFPAGAAETKYELNIEAGSADVTLKSLAVQTGHSVIFQSDLVRSVQTQAIAGQYSLHDALTALLSNTELSWGLTSGGVITITLAQAETELAGAGDMHNKQQDKSFFKNLAAAIAIAFTSSSVVAQEEEAGAKVLEEVIVTALKREQSLMETPIAVSAFTGDWLEEIGASDLADFLQSAPGTSIVDSSNGDQSISIRGISSLYGDSPVGYYLDEVPFNFIGIPLVPDVRTFDLERVEVLRGPQGTLYGSSSLGGTVRILTRDPVFNEFQGKLDLTGSNTHDGGSNYGVKAAINLPLVDDRLALRLVGTTEDYSGWLDDPTTGAKDVNDRDIQTLRAKLLWAPTDAVQLVLGAWAYRSDAGAGAIGNDDGEYVNSVFPGSGLLTPTAIDYDLYSALLTINTQYFDVVSSTSYLDFEYLLGGAFTVFRPADTFAQEIRFTSNTEGRWQWTAGAFYRDLTTAFAFELPPFPASTQDTSSESWAVFGELSYAFTEELEGTVGLRQFEDTRDRYDTVVVGELIEIEFEEKYSKTSPRFNLAWTPSENAMFYANIAQGFRSGQLQPGISLYISDLVGIDIPTGAGPETAWSYELGSKTTFADGRMALETAVYYLDWQDLQTVISIIPGALGALVNAGEAGAIGLDFSLTALVTDGLEVGVSGNINDSEYKETITDVGGIVVEDGQQIQGFPARTLTGFANYGWDIGHNDWRGVSMFRIDHTSERTLNFGSVTTESDSITQASFRIGVEAGKWGAYLFADNLFDEDGKLDGPGITPATSDLATRLRPRTIGLNLRYDW